MIPRTITHKLLELATKFSVVSITGPRQAGKTTLIQNIFPEKPYISLEDLDKRLLAQNDPRGFLRNYPDGAVLDEVQRVPELFSYIQTIVDNAKQDGMFILSGSQSFLLSDKISQSLAGRVAIFRLLPFTYDEMVNGNIEISDLNWALYHGTYPRVFDKNISPIDYYPNYIQTYIERDVRQLLNVQNLDAFSRFIKLCAGHVGQLLNYSSLANDCGISVNTVKAWLSILEASYIIHFLRPHFKNFNKRLVKMPKLYFYDSGLVCFLLGLENSKQVSNHYLRGELFENYVVSELLKYRYNRGLQPNCYFWRDSKGNEIDCLLEQADKLIPVEIKSGQTVTAEYFKHILFWNKISNTDKTFNTVIYGGDSSIEISNGKIKSWRDIRDLLDSLSNR